MEVENEANGFSLRNYGRIKFAYSSPNYYGLLDSEEIDRRVEATLRDWEIMASGSLRSGVYVNGQLQPDDYDGADCDPYDDYVELS